MSLASSSYDAVPVLGDDAGLLNLAWSLDERDFLAADLAGVVAATLDAHVPYVDRYLVQDPYGEGVLAESVARFFGLTGRWGVTAGAGVSSLLHAVAHLPGRGPVQVVGEAYPDLPQWAARSGRGCMPWAGADAARAAGASIVLVDRPAVTGSDRVDVDGLARLAGDVAPSGALVVVDESYGNYWPPSYSAARVVPEVDNLMVLRGLSKAYSLGGVRLGYCLSSDACTPAVRSAVAPMLASSVSLEVGRAVLDLGDVAQPLRDRVAEVKPELVALLEGIGVAATATGEHVPYVLVDDDERVRSTLEARGVLGKRQPVWSASTGAVTHWYRVSVPLRQDRVDTLRRRLGTGRRAPG